MADLQWTTYSSQQPLKRRRAEAACIVCHAKKIRCDLQTRKSQGFDACTACITANNDCHPRVSKRERVSNDVRQPENGDAIGGNTDQAANISLVQGISALEPGFQPLHPGQLISQESQNLVDPYENNRNNFTASSNTQTTQQHSSSLSQPELNESTTDISPFTSSKTDIGNMSGYVLDTGFVYVYGPEHEHDANRQASIVEPAIEPPSLIRPELLQSYAETYFEYCYPWCPVLDKADLFETLKHSPLLADALALAGSHIQPPIFSRVDPAEYYNRARKRFYDDEEPDVVLSLRAIALFYWWSTRSPASVHRHSSWWWTSVIIRHAQQLGIHRELPSRPALSKTEIGLRRRLWWTAFARERLTAMCQGKPCVIDPEECSIKEISLDDFPPDADQSKAEIFIYWVRLCTVIGKVAKYMAKLSRSTTASQSDHPGKELVEWVRSLPCHMRLPIDRDRTDNFNRNVHQLYLPYLAVVIVLHLKRAGSSLPAASTSAILAATCIARIYKDILIRGGSRFLMPINCWYCGTAFLALSHASKSPDLKVMAEEELDVLYATIRELQKMWGTANIFEQGFRRLRAILSSHERETAEPSTNGQASQVIQNKEDNDMNWLDSFPFATSETSPIARTLFAKQDGVLDLFADFPDDFISLLYPELLGSFGGTDFDNTL